MSEYYFCLLDCMSIQPYIFSSNKLRTNIGASELVEKMYDDFLFNVLKEQFGVDKAILEAWKAPATIGQMALQKDENKDQKVEIAYIGGGNALLVFRKEDFD